MRYLITGGAGFIGSHLADALVARGDSVDLLDDLSTGLARNVRHLLDGPGADRARFVQGSVLDDRLVRRLVEDCDAVVHLAATVGVQLVIRKPLEALVNNIRGTEVLLEAVLSHPRKVLVTSTSEIYGKNAAGPLHEDADRILGSLFNARWAYSISKAVDEILAHELWRSEALPTVIARMFNCAGPRQSAAYGMVIPRFVRQALSGEDLTVFGEGKQSRCFCHVSDTVRALLALLDTEEVVGGVFNVGARNETTILDLARLVVERTGSSSGITFVPYDRAYEAGFEDMERRLPDIGRITRATGWRPERTLVDIVDDVVAFEVEASVAGSR